MASAPGLLAGCISEEQAGSGGGGSGGDAIVIGGFSTLTGATAFTGQAFQRGAELAVEAVNARGGVLDRPLELLWEDDGGSAAGAVSLAREYLRDRGVDFLLGGHNSAVTLAVSEQARLAEVPFMAASGTTVLTTEQFHPYIFRGMLQNDFALANSAAEMAAEQPWQTFFMIGGDYEYPHNFWRLFQEELTRLKGDVRFVGEQWPAFGASDYSAQINAILSAQPDVVVSALWSGEVVTFAQQARGFGYFDQVEHFGPAQVQVEQAQALGADTPPVITGGMAHPFWAIENDVTRDMVAAYRERFGETPTDWTGCSYSGVLFLEAGINEAGSAEPDAFVAGLEGLEVDTAWGPVEMRACDHQALIPSHWGRVAEVPELQMSLMSEGVEVFEAGGDAALYESCEVIEGLRSS